MRLVAGADGWSGGPSMPGAPAVAVLELSGAVLEWTVDDPNGAAAPRMTVTDVLAADWLWRIVGPTGHAALVSGAGPADLELLPDAVTPLRRLAIGYWLRRWWPESRRDGIARLDRALLDGELALLVSAAQEFFTEDTLDSDVEGLLVPHRTRLRRLGREDPRIAGIARSCFDLADEAGLWSSEEAGAEPFSARGLRDEYALAAGNDGVAVLGAIAGGTASIDWLAVPPRTFDAAEDTVDWSVAAADSSVFATVRVALTGEASPAGIDVLLRAGEVSASGVLDAGGTAGLPLLSDDGGVLTEIRAWDHDWSSAAVVVGPDRDRIDLDAAATLRRRIRDFARTRLAHPGPDAFLAEIVAAESDY